MTTLRDEARNTETAPERLHELIHLPGNRGDIDSDSGWCREYVATNPSASVETLRELAADTDDCMARLGVAKNPTAPDELVATLVDDHNDIVANAARHRLGQPARPQPQPHVVHIPRIDPATGRIIR